MNVKDDKPITTAGPLTAKDMQDFGLTLLRQAPVQVETPNWLLKKIVEWSYLNSRQQGVPPKLNVGRRAVIRNICNGRSAFIRWVLQHQPNSPQAYQNEFMNTVRACYEKHSWLTSAEAKYGRPFDGENSHRADLFTRIYENRMTESDRHELEEFNRIYLNDMEGV